MQDTTPAIESHLKDSAATVWVYFYLLKTPYIPKTEFIRNNPSLDASTVSKVWDDIENNDTLIYNTFEDYYSAVFLKLEKPLLTAPSQK